MRERVVVVQPTGVGGQQSYFTSKCCFELICKSDEHDDGEDDEEDKELSLEFESVFFSNNSSEEFFLLRE